MNSIKRTIVGIISTMTDDQYDAILVKSATKAATQLGWNKDMEDNPVEFLVQKAYEEGFVEGVEKAEEFWVNDGQ